jgi:hypothetical protein
VDRRVTVVVALFVGAIALLGTWLLLSSDAKVSPTARTPGIQAEAVSGTKGPELRRRPVPPEDVQRGSTLDEFAGARDQRRPDHGTRERIPVHRRFGWRRGGGCFAPGGARRVLRNSFLTPPGSAGSAILHGPDRTERWTDWGTITSVEAAGPAHGTVLETCALDVLGQVRFHEVTGPRPSPSP